MKIITLAFIPLLLAGIMLPDEQCNNTKPHTTRFDGPYVMYRPNQVVVQYILDDHGTRKVQTERFPLTQKKDITLQVATDDPARMFSVKLRDKLEAEKTDYPETEKLYVISDIEGEFGAFRKLLLAGGIIDAEYNWTFGSGHLVLTGDFVDRGSMQTEVLWLIYALEEKAKAAGGYVHFILGNHEIMNLSGDLRYLHPKYKESVSLLVEEYTSLIGETSEIGRWLRTKNVMEKIGDILFLHGGVSAPVNRMDLSTSRLNKLVRPYYDDSTYSYKNATVDTLYSDYGPFWYRGYYTNSPSIEIQTVETTLRQYKVKKIATGHTVIADTISAVFGGKVINTDVHHLKGHSEALLVESGNYYRVLPSGEKKPLFK
jgi:hypothetical protein